MQTKKHSPVKVVTAYKGFDQSLRCRGFQFEVGKTYEHTGKVQACASGFHSCEYPLDIFVYYAPVDSRFAAVTASGELSLHRADSKIASAIITITAEIGLPELTSHAVYWVMNKLDHSINQTLIGGLKSADVNTADYSVAVNTGERSVAANTGYQSAAMNAGLRSAATNMGLRSVAVNTGGRSTAINTGIRSTAVNTGIRSTAVNTGDYSTAANMGHHSAATNIGLGSVAVNTGERSIALNMGPQSVAVNTGGYSTAANTNLQSVALNMGHHSAADVKGTESVAAALGIQGRARAGTGGAIILCHRDKRDGHLIHIRAAKVGEHGIQPDTWYTLDAHGEFIKLETTPAEDSNN